MSKHLRILWLTPLILTALSIAAAAFEARTFEDMPYRLLMPKNYDAKQKYPLVLFFHGAGECGADNNNQLKNAVQRFSQPAIMDQFPCFVAVPQCPFGSKWVDTPWGAPSHTMADQPTAPMAKALSLCDALIKEFSIDKGRIYAVGLSMGGYGTWDALMRRPDFFAAGVPICGGADDTKAKLIKDIPVWVFHGAMDPTVPVTRSRNIVAALKAAGADPKYTEYPSVNHKSWNQAISEPELMPWLFAQKRVIKKAASALKDIPTDKEREIRTWTSKKGSKIEARLLETTGRGATAVLLKADGSRASISASMLSQEDQDYIKQLKDSL